MENINLIVVFIEGLLSFFSPCILPILPIYLGMLSNSSIQDLRENETTKTRGVLIRNTLFFALGITSTFFILGTSIGYLSDLINDYKDIITIVGGALIIILGLFYMGVLNITLLQREKRFSMKSRTMNPITSYILGFTFSFGWTPCIGPMLASVLVLVSTSKNQLSGNLLIGIYSLGFILPFIVSSLFYNKLFNKLDSLKKHMGTIKKIGGIILIATGIIMLVNGVIAIDHSSIKYEQIQTEDSQSSDEIKPPDFTLYDQYGKEHTLSDYKGKVVFLNFWATWCPPCRGEMPHIEEIYKEYGLNKDEVVILGVASPNMGKEGSREEIKSFLENGNYTFPTVFDDGSLVYKYGIEAYPSTFIIDKEGYVRQYIPGALDKNTMEYLINASK